MSAPLAMVVPLCVAAVSVAAFLRLSPRGVDVALVQRFNRRSLALLLVLCSVVFVALVWRTTAGALSAFLLLVLFLPIYLLGAALVRSRCSPHSMVVDDQRYDA